MRNSHMVSRTLTAVGISLAFLLLPSALQAQRQDFMARGEVLLGGGGKSYIGDLNNQSALGMPHLAFTVGLRERIDNRWATRFAFASGSVGCDHDYIARRNLSFRSDIYEFSGIVEFNFRPFGAGSTESQWTPYLFGGIGAFYFNPEASYVDAGGRTQWVSLQPLCTEGQGTSANPRQSYRLMQLCLPFGMGVRWRFGKTFSLAVEYGFRKTWTDYLDDVSTTYADPAVLRAEVSDGDLAARMADRSSEVEPGYVNAAGIKRGDDSLDDWYSFFNLSVGISLETLLGWTRNKRCEL